MTTVVSTAPLRLSLSGGGTDLPEFYRHGPTSVTAVAVDRFVHVAVADTPEQARRTLPDTLPYRVGPAEADRHPYVRAARTALGLDGPAHLAVASDVLPGSGLGGSGAFTVALLDALARYAGRTPGPRETAALAFRLERHALGRPVGQQDQWIAALGGAARMTFSPDGTVDAGRDPDLFAMVAELLADSLVLARTGQRRDAARVLGTALPVTQEDYRSAVAAGRTMDRAYRSGDPREIGRALRAHWAAKVRRNPAADHPAGRRVQEAAGAAVHGLKVVGAGGGGHLLLAVDPSRRPDALDALTRLGLTPLQVRAWPRGLQQGLPDREDPEGAHGDGPGGPPAERPGGAHGENAGGPDAAEPREGEARTCAWE